MKSRAAAAWIAVAGGLTAGAGYPLIDLLGGLVGGLVYGWICWWQSTE